MDILVHIVKANKPPFEEYILNTVFPVTVKTVLSSDDNAVLQVSQMLMCTKCATLAVTFIIDLCVVCFTKTIYLPFYKRSK